MFCALRKNSRYGIRIYLNIGPSSARQRNAISMAFRWCADNGPTFSGIWILSPPYQLQKTLDPLLQNFWIRACYSAAKF